MWTIGQSSQDIYLKQIKSFLTDNKAFSIFKSTWPYLSIIGAPSFPQAVEYYQAFKDVPDIRLNLQALSLADLIGGPPTFSFAGTFYSLNLIRAIDSIRLLKREFGSLNDKNILEIGVGYGLLYHCILTMWPNVKSYTGIDFPEVLDLCDKNSIMLGHKPMQRTQPENVNIAVAEYSVTELYGDDLWNNTNDFLMKSDNIFIRSNFIDNNLKEEWLTSLRNKFNLTIEKEVGNLYGINRVVVGKL